MPNIICLWPIFTSLSLVCCTIFLVRVGCVVAIVPASGIPERFLPLSLCQRCQRSLSFFLCSVCDRPTIKTEEEAGSTSALYTHFGNRFVGIVKMFHCLFTTWFGPNKKEERPHLSYKTHKYTRTHMDIDTVKHLRALFCVCRTLTFWCVLFSYIFFLSGTINGYLTNISIGLYGPWQNVLNLE